MLKKVFKCRGCGHTLPIDFYDRYGKCYICTPFKKGELEKILSDKLQLKPSGVEVTGE